MMSCSVIVHARIGEEGLGDPLHMAFIAPVNGMTSTFLPRPMSSASAGGGLLEEADGGVLVLVADVPVRERLVEVMPGAQRDGGRGCPRDRSLETPTDLV